MHGDQPVDRQKIIRTGSLPQVHSHRVTGEDYDVE